MLDAETNTELDTQTETPEVDPQTETKQTLSLDEALDALKKARGEAAESRVKAKEAREALEAAQAKQAEDIAAKTKEIETLTETQKELKLKLQLAGRVIDVDKAIRLVDDADDFDVEQFLQDNSFLVSKPTVTNPASNKSSQTKGALTTEDISKMTKEEQRKYWESVM